LERGVSDFNKRRAVARALRLRTAALAMKGQEMLHGCFWCTPLV
jgi:hypothetical protein